MNALLDEARSLIREQHAQKGYVGERQNDLLALALVEAQERQAVALDRIALALERLAGPVRERPLQEDCPTCGVGLPNHDPKCPYATEGA